jgi:hypothetical protein
LPAKEETMCYSTASVEFARRKTKQALVGLLDAM